MTDHHTNAIELTLRDAQAMVGSVVAAAGELGKPVCVTVLDSGGTVVASARMDGARLIASASSIAKARTALMFGAATADLVAAVQPGAVLYGIESCTTDPLAFIPGGVPIRIGDRLAGAIGVGGAAPGEDHEMCQQAARVVEP